MFSSIIWVILFIGILIIFHEFGHLVAAKLSHIPVEVFDLVFQTPHTSKQATHMKVSFLVSKYI